MELLKQRDRTPGIRRETARDLSAQTRVPSVRRRGRRVWLGSLVAVLTPVFFAAAVRGEVIKEYDVKATYLYHLAQYVEWPAEAFPESGTPFVIGVLGQDPFGKILDDVVQNEIVKSRKLVVQRFRNADEIGVCHVLFISRSEEGRLAQIFSSVKGRNIVTVGDSEGFARLGGVVRFVTEKNRIGLRINIDAAKTAKVTISSKLLRAAEVIGSQGGRP